MHLGPLSGTLVKEEAQCFERALAKIHEDNILILALALS